MKFAIRHRKRAVLLLLVLLIPLCAVLWNVIFKNWILKIEYPREYRVYVEKYAAQYHVDQALVYAVIKNESDFDPNAESSIGARGLMQLTPDTFDWAQSRDGVRQRLPAERLYDPATNVKYGTRVLSELLGEFRDTRTALAAYHAGRNNVKKWLADPNYSQDGETVGRIPFKNTSVYVARVLKARQIYSTVYRLE